MHISKLITGVIKRILTSQQSGVRCFDTGAVCHHRSSGIPGLFYKCACGGGLINAASGGFSPIGLAPAPRNCAGALGPLPTAAARGAGPRRAGAWGALCSINGHMRLTCVWLLMSHVLSWRMTRSSSPGAIEVPTFHARWNLSTVLAHHRCVYV